MTGARRRALLLFIVGALILGAIGFGMDRIQRPPAKRPTLLLLTSLPLVFGESFALQATGSPALEALRHHYNVVPISVTDPAELAKGRMLLMAQPLAQPAEDLVALDTWVRGGGHLLLFADPLLEWPSDRSFGDPLRPAATFADTGLLAHWGLRLDPPLERGPVHQSLGGQGIVTDSPGRLSGPCAIGAARLVARCRIGKGQVVVVADADLLDGPRLGRGASRNLDAVLSELAALSG